MINFDGEKIKDALKRKKFAVNTAYCTFAVLLISAVIAAVLTRDALVNGKNQIAHVSALCFTAAVLLALIGEIIFYVVPLNRELTLCVCTNLSDGLLARRDLFSGDGEIAFSVDYSGDVLTLARKGFKGEITVDPAKNGGLNLSGGKIEIDLKGLKSAPALYSTVGAKLWQFLQGYYVLHGKEAGVKLVKVTDNMGKKPLVLTVFDENSPAKNADKNYFLKKELIR